MPAGQSPHVSRTAKAIALALPLLLLVLLELIFRVTGVGRPQAADPFIGLLRGHRVFQLDPASGNYVIDRERARSFNPQGFPARKPAGTFRIFCLGGSAAYGYPFGDPVSFSRWLREACPAVWPGRSFEVVNAAGMSYGTYRERALLEELLEYEPDLVVLYSGHNEFIEKELYSQPQAQRFLRVRSLLGRVHTYNALKSAVLGLTSSRRKAQTRVDEFGLHVKRRENVSWTAEERERVFAKYRENLTEIARLLRRRNVPLILLSPAPNLATWKPEHSALRPDLAADSLSAWSMAYGTGMAEQSAGDLEAALTLYRRALRIDDTHAELHYRTARCLEALGSHDEARDHYRAALDLDQVPIRLTSRQRDIDREVARAERVPFADAWSLFENIAAPASPGAGLFWDYCHPDIRGHQLVAALACSVMVASRLVPDPDPELARALAGPVEALDRSRIGMVADQEIRLTSLPKGADGLWWLGNCAQRQGSAAEAVSWYEQALQGDPNHPGALIGLAIARSQEGRHEEAIQMGQRAVTAYERAGFPVLVARSRYELAVFLSRAGRHAEAAEELRRVLQVNRSHPGAHRTLGRALAETGDLAQSERVLREGIGLLPREAGLHKELGRTLRLGNRLGEAISEYEAETRIAPGDAGTRFLLGDLYRLDNRPAEAAAQWEVALNLDSRQDQVARQLRDLYLTLGQAEDANRIAARFIAKPTHLR